MDTVSFRLPPELVEGIATIARRHGVDRSAIVREALESYLRRQGGSARPTRGALVDRLVTYRVSGVGDLATQAEQHLRARFRARRRPR
jgi:metal-responsive CopG/Arc/MetJ family transcriptional regulator